MGSNIKFAAETLFKIADKLEKEAAENTYFVCDSCNHTASLSDINAKRKVAGEGHNVKRVANVSVNDGVACLACGGKMAYVPTETSQKYYVEAEDTEEDTGSDIFEPVDQQGEVNDGEPSNAPVGEVPAPEGEEGTPDSENVAPDSENDTPPSVEQDTPDTGEDVSKDPSDTTEIADYDGTPDGEDTPEDAPTDGEPAMEETPDMGNDAPTDGETSDIESPISGTPDSEPSESEDPMSETPSEGDSDNSGENPVTEETVTEDTLEGAPEDGTEDNSDNENVEIPKKDVPKFEKIPKDAGDAFWISVAKYSM